MYSTFNQCEAVPICPSSDSNTISKQLTFFWGNVLFFPNLVEIVVYIIYITVSNSVLFSVVFTLLMPNISRILPESFKDMLLVSCYTM
jgi:hypothetical protein